MVLPVNDTIVQNFRVRNFTKENLKHEELSCLIQFISSLDICKTCLAAIPQLESSFGSNLNYSIDFETKTLEIHYAKSIVSGW